MLTIPETRRTEATLSNLLFYAYRRRVADFEECLAKFGAEGGFNLNALNDVDWVTVSNRNSGRPPAAPYLSHCARVTGSPRSSCSTNLETIQLRRSRTRTP